MIIHNITVSFIYGKEFRQHYFYSIKDEFLPFVVLKIDKMKGGAINEIRIETIDTISKEIEITKI